MIELERKEREQALMEQRDGLANQVVVLRGQIAILKSTIKELEDGRRKDDQDDTSGR